MPLTLKPSKLGFVPANRGFFSTELAQKMRNQTIEVMKNQGIEVVVPDENQTKAGCVETLQEAEICAKLFRDANVDGIVIGAMNFGDEQSAAWVVKQARLDVPILIFGCQEEEVLTMNTSRRDSFCGLLSIGEALRQIGAKFTVAQRPICFPKDDSFKTDLDHFIRICRVVNGVRNARYGQIGARPEAFWTCRYDEKQLQRLGATTVVLDLSELIAGANNIADDDNDIKQIVTSINDYADTSNVQDSSVIRSAKVELFLKRWKEENNIDAFGIQCWTSIQQNFGVCTCTTMSRFGDMGIPSACEADILGTLSMHAAMLASGEPAGLADWNNLHNADDELVNLWHCGVFPKAFAKSKPMIKSQEILVSSGVAPLEQSQGTCEFVAKEAPVTITRVTQDPDGSWKVVIAEGDIEDNPAVTFGAYGWCRLKDLQSLYRDVLVRHFPHHCALTLNHCGNVLWEAFGNYLDMNVYHAGQAVQGVYSPVLPFTK